MGRVETSGYARKGSEALGNMWKEVDTLKKKKRVEKQRGALKQVKYVEARRNARRCAEARRSAWGFVKASGSALDRVEVCGGT